MMRRFYSSTYCDMTAYQKDFGFGGLVGYGGGVPVGLVKEELNRYDR